MWYDTTSKSDGDMTISFGAFCELTLHGIVDLLILTL